MMGVVDRIKARNAIARGGCITPTVGARGISELHLLGGASQPLQAHELAHVTQGHLTVMPTGQAQPVQYGLGDMLHSAPTAVMRGGRTAGGMRGTSQRRKPTRAGGAPKRKRRGGPLGRMLQNAVRPVVGLRRLRPKKMTTSVSRAKCPGQIICADGRCVDSVSECDLKIGNP